MSRLRYSFVFECPDCRCMSRSLSLSLLYLVFLWNVLLEGFLQINHRDFHCLVFQIRVVLSRTFPLLKARFAFARERLLLRGLNWLRRSVLYRGRLIRSRYFVLLLFGSLLLKGLKSWFEAFLWVNCLRAK